MTAGQSHRRRRTPPPLRPGGSYLARRYGVSVPLLERAYFQVEVQEVEPDFYGVGHRDGRPVAIAGEAKSRIYGRDVEQLAPSVQEAADRSGAIVIAFRGS